MYMPCFRNNVAAMCEYKKTFCSRRILDINNHKLLEK